ncbi:G-protein beta WD-40 repeats containing protein [Reticulomyxa filosa]|uniref:G-protein beta WD-40 repeats containing protein n=1 Tax=Reticulomyxa filosa TaxID=46433 RepID=X6MK86_RETFI|nr:G-protein beta WD-40 repeats containing protein [Reticulomyxa filosa]|eukprot:ETO13475.1 G-protein beta WD-40 repeats containing protein [Reticulomyxa filosa]
MLIVQVEETERIKTLSLEGCYDKNWLASTNKLKHLQNFQCLLCNQIANNAMELTCNEHEDHKETLVVGEQCLIQYLSENNNQCPVGKHKDCTYVKVRALRNVIGGLKVICLQQFIIQSNLKTNMQTKKGDIITEAKQCCKFKGKLEEMKDHLGNECPLKPLECKFKKFGCDDVLYVSNFEQHLQLQMKKHLDLLLNYIIRQSNPIEETEKLKLKIKEQENEIRSLKLDNENKTIQIENCLKEKQKWDEKEKEVKEQHIQFTNLDELNQLKSKINESDIINTEMNQLEKQIQSKCDEINKLNHDIECKDKQIADKDNLIQQIQTNIETIKKDFHDKEKQLSSHYEKTNKGFEEKYSKLTQDYQSVVKKLNEKNGTKEQKKQIDKDNFSFLTLTKLLNTFNGHTDRVTIRVWDVDNNKQIQLFNGHAGEVYCVKFSQYHYQNHRCNIICSSSFDKTIRFWDIKNNQQLQIFKGHTGGVNGIEFSIFNGGRYLCSGSDDWTIRLWDVETSNSLHIFNEQGSACCVAISPLQSHNNNDNSVGVIGGNGYTICSGLSDNTICMWDIETTKQSIIFEGHGDHVKKIIGYSNTILSGSNDKSVRLWDIRSGQQIQVFKGHVDYVNAVEYLPFVIKNGSDVIGDSSNVICSGSMDNTIRFWDIRSNKNGLYMIKGDKEDEGIRSLKFLSLQKKEKENEYQKNDYCFNLCYGNDFFVGFDD